MFLLALLSYIQVVKIFRGIIYGFVVSVPTTFVTDFLSSFFAVLYFKNLVEFFASKTCLTLHGPTLIPISYCLTNFCLLFISLKLRRQRFRFLRLRVHNFISFFNFWLDYRFFYILMLISIPRGCFTSIIFGIFCDDFSGTQSLFHSL
jgi:hypothetical protein